MAGLLDQVGYAAALVAYEPEPGRLVLIDGHLRAEVTPDVEVPVLVVDLTDDEARLVLSTLDPVAQLAESSDDVLRGLLDSVNGAAESVQKFLDELRPPEIPTSLTDPDDVPEPQEHAISQRGDLWLLNDHRLLCGDATSAEDVGHALDGATPLLMVTDPPYGVEYDPMWRGVLSHAEVRRGGAIANDDRADWSDAWALFPGDVIYCWSAPRSLQITSGIALIKSGFEIRGQMIWRKSHFPIGRGHYTDRHEPCWYAVRKGETAHWIGDRSESTMWEAALDPTEGRLASQKPVEVMERPIRNHDAPQVYDPFVGSGTTLIAAERRHRAAITLEIAPIYVDVAVRRWQAYTGKEATLDGGGTFAEVEQQRAVTA